MPYIGNDLQVAYPTYKNIDDIRGSFNSSTTSFPLLVNGVAPVPPPLNSQQCLISVGGVVQRPDDSGTEGFRLSGGNIVFASAPATGADFFGVILAGADYVNAGGNFPSGSAAVPSITFDSDIDTGIFNSGPNELTFTTGGIERFEIGANGQVGLGGASYGTNGQVLTSSGAGSAPTWQTPAGGDVFLASNNAFTGNNTFTGTVAVGQSSAAANTDFDLAGTYAQTVVAVGALDIDCSAGNYFTKTINANSTFTVSNVPASRAFSFTLELTHTSGTITWFSGVEWPGGSAPTLTTGKTHLFMFVTDDGGTRWRASSLVDYTT